jgi:hypothetical protein
MVKRSAISKKLVDQWKIKASNRKEVSALWNEEQASKLSGTSRLTWSQGRWEKIHYGQYGQIVEMSPIEFDKVERELSSFAIAQITFIGARLGHANIWRW